MNDVFFWSQTDLQWVPYYLSPQPNIRGKYAVIGPSPENIPGGRHAALVWFQHNIDAQRLWVFGGLGYGAGSNPH
jgi:hypothetical protein